MRTALTRAPGPALARCELTFMERRPIEVNAAIAEHEAMERALADLGCRVLRLPPLPDLPDAAFVEDIAVVLDEVAIVTRPGAASRRPETEGMEAVLAPFRPVRRILEPATLEGCDVLLRGRTIHVRRSGRTNAEGIAGLAAAVEPYGYRVVPVQLIVLTADGHPRTRRRLEALGIHVRTTPMAELMRAEAGVTCCCIELDVQYAAMHSLHGR